MSEDIKKHWALGAVSEVMLNLIVILIPFGIGFFRYGFYNNGDQFGLINALTESFSVMAVTIFSATVVAPIFYSIIKDPPIKFKAVFLISSILIYTFGVGIYIFEIMEATVNSSLQIVAWIVLGFAIFLYTFNICVNHYICSTASAPVIMIDRSETAVNEYIKHRSK